MGDDHTPQRYRRRSLIVDALRNTGRWGDIIVWLDAIPGGRHSLAQVAAVTGSPPVVKLAGGALAVFTREGTMRCEVGDWLIRGVRGEFYPCTPDVFEATYEAVDGDA